MLVNIGIAYVLVSAHLKQILYVITELSRIKNLNIKTVE